MKIQRILYKAFVLFNLILAVYFMLYTINMSRGDQLWDFQVFYGAARNVIAGISIYTYYGLAHLPYWYLPWVSWLFLPLAVFPFEIAWYLFLAIGLLIVAAVIYSLTRHYQGVGVFDRIYMFSMIIWMSWQVYRVGQMSYYVLGGAVLAMFLLAGDRKYLAGLCMPLLLMKPHLFIVFIPLALWMGGWKTFLSGALATLGLCGIEFLITPDWVRQMLGSLIRGVGNVDINIFWKFSTLPTLLGFHQNITGTADIPITAVLVIIAAYIVYRFRSLPKMPLLAFALVASLFCAPRSYAYDLVQLIPAMIWLSEKWSPGTALIWFGAALIPVLSHFSDGSFFVTLIVFVLCIIKAYSIENRNRIPVFSPGN
jgi:alpha-1,2-mannosyltransferase